MQILANKLENPAGIKKIFHAASRPNKGPHKSWVNPFDTQYTRSER